MSNLLAKWWRSRQFHSALKQGNSRLAEQLLQDIENSGARLSWLEKLFRDKLQSVQSAHQFKRDAVTISGRLKQASHKIEELKQELFPQPGKIILKPDAGFIKFI